VLYVPSVHCAVAFAGRAAAVLPAGADLGAAVDDVGAGVFAAGAVFVVDAAALPPPYHVFTPPCFEHAPLCVLAVV
jgi:hypothetical protein